MATTKEFFKELVNYLAPINGLGYRAMMGEYVVYYREKVIGGIYDNRLMVKPVPAAKEIMPEAQLGIPYQSSKPMLEIPINTDIDTLRKLFDVVFEALREKKRKNK